ncbi:MAG: hypothetical protein EKK48_09335 [Candidatus Melainabacteria bacterium]|nr:MAG: hypothetical protein EKK48_09335 [Candidatus Melainabacteria bacterium]
MSSSTMTADLQGISFLNDAPEALIFALTHNSSTPNEVLVSFELGYGEPCTFDMDLTRLRRALLPETCVFHAIMPYSTAETEFVDIRKTLEGDFVSGFQAGFIFDLIIEGIEHQVWLPLDGLLQFLDSVPGLKKATHDCSAELTVSEEEFDRIRPKPL